MIKVETKFVPGDKVYVVLQGPHRLCEACLGSATVSIRGKEYPCPACGGLGRQGLEPKQGGNNKPNSNFIAMPLLVTIQDKDVYPDTQKSRYDKNYNILVMYRLEISPYNIHHNIEEEFLFESYDAASEYAKSKNAAQMSTNQYL